MDTIVILAILAITLFLSYEYQKKNQQAVVGNYETQFFHISGSRSLDTFNTMKAAGLSDETLMKFVTMEDKFLSLEKDVVCRSDTSRRIEAIDLSQQIRETFPVYDFSYHTHHLKQMAEPDKMVNKSLSCY